MNQRKPPARQTGVRASVTTLPACSGPARVRTCNNFNAAARLLKRHAQPLLGLATTCRDA